jgi:hypothetical protein
VQEHELTSALHAARDRGLRQHVLLLANVTLPAPSQARRTLCTYRQSVQEGSPRHSIDKASANTGSEHCLRYHADSFWSGMTGVIVEMSSSVICNVTSDFPLVVRPSLLVVSTKYLPQLQN